MLLREEIFMRFSVVFVIISAAFASNRNGFRAFDKISPLVSPSKKMMVANIIKKVSNLTSNYLSKTPLGDKENALKKIEYKLKNSARSMGFDGDKYVELIMKGIKLNTIDESSKNESLNDMEYSLENDDEVSTNNTNLDNKNFAGKDMENENQGTENKGKESIRTKKVLKREKNKVIRNIAKKIEILSRSYLKHIDTPEAKHAALTLIKKKFMESAQKKHKELHKEHADIKEYKNLITQGFELLMRRSLPEVFGRSHYTDANDTHKLEKISDDVDFDLINEVGSYINNNLTSPEICSNAIEETCFVIQSLNKLTCHNGNNVPINTLCNGITDCTDGSDEVNCTGHVMDKLHKASDIMTEVETFLSHKCLKPNIVESIISPQNQVLRNVLQTQIDFLNMYTQSNVSSHIKSRGSRLSKTLNDVALLLGTLSLALKTALCSPKNKTEIESFTELIDMELAEEPIDAWAPRSCTCEQQYCLHQDCPTPCKRVCFHKYSLFRWGCQAIGGGNSIDLDLICDGKLDCFDESDENGCATGSYAKFESVDIYKEASDMILEKTKLQEYEISRNNLVALYGLVQQLQRATASSSADPQTIKTIREKTFRMLVKIYEGLLETQTLPELDIAYIFLVNINEKLIEAMKRSRTGNRVILTPGQCFCREGLCALRTCSKKCIKTCMLEPLLTRFACGVHGNKSINLENVCNRINNCPNGEDEIGCKKDICRPHHLVKLRHNIRDIGENRKGTALGEVMLAWKTKVTAALVIEEKSHRVTPKIIADVVSTILQDLVLAYSTLDDKILNNDYVLVEFQNTARVVKKSLKSCT